MQRRRGAVPRIGWVLFIAGVLWTMAYDTMYAMVDREDDLKIGIRSSAILFGDADRFIVGIMQLMMLFALWLAGTRTETRVLVRTRTCDRGDFRAVPAIPHSRAQTRGLLAARS